ncbi:hypothetical protein ACGFWD_02020 [Streptomyces sp. NPDC048448]|uniref:hypothetical protein n=1 Tax=Streptomyces sp. NPDC048448 TaxID=3365554 RepID=UPI0037232B65
MTFADHLQCQATKGIASIPAADAHDIYGVSFFIDNEDDDPRQPVLTIGYNTEAQVSRTLPDTADPAEARWNYAFWLQNELTLIGNRSSDPVGAATRDEWIRELGLWYDDPVDASDWVTAVGALAAQIEGQFNQACCRLARSLHATGVIEKYVGRPVPVLVHELEYYEGIARRTEAANPSGLADEFTAWVRNG